MRLFTTSIMLILISSCTAVKLAVPEQFSQHASKMHVKGLNGWMINQQLSFGRYQTSVVKRGWDLGSSFQHTKLSLKPEEMLLRVFDIDTDKSRLSQRNKFQFTLYDGQLEAAVFASEKFSEKGLVYKSRNPWIGDISKTGSYEYAFTAAILPAIPGGDTPWSVVITDKLDSRQNSSPGVFERPATAYEGYATNGKDVVTIRPLFLDKVKQKNGKESKVVGGGLLTGYELKWDDGVVGIVDILDNNIWLANNLDAGDRLLISSISSAIFLKRMQDVEKDRDALNN